MSCGVGRTRGLRDRGMKPHGEAKPFPLAFLQEEEDTVKRHRVRGWKD